MPRPLSDYAERHLERFLYEGAGKPSLFLEPRGEPGLVPLGGVNARVYSHPLTVYIGGMAAVLLELAEPRVRHGVWDHSVFPTDPVLRLRRTGLAAMVTVYAARSVAEPMIAGVNRRHAGISGRTDCGQPYRAADPELLSWVQGTAAFGFIGAYDRYAEGIGETGWDAALREALPVARAYGVPAAPQDRRELLSMIAAMTPRLEPSPVLAEFMRLMRDTPTLPPPGQALQPLFLRAAVSLLPAVIRQRLDLAASGLRPGEGPLVRLLMRGTRLLRLRNHPAALARQRMGAPAIGTS